MSTDRWLDSEDEGALRDLLQSASADQPDAEALARLQASAAQLGPPPAATPPAADVASIQGASAGASGASPGTAAGGLGVGARKLLVWTAVAAAAAAASFVLVDSGPSQNASEPALPSSVPMAGADPAPSEPAPPQPTSPPAVEPAVQQPPRVDSAPARRMDTPQAPSRPRQRKAPAVAPEQSAAAQLAEEVRLLSRMRASVTDDPAETLKLADEHRKRFAKPTLASERDLLELRAMFVSGQTARAARRAQAWLDRRPGGPYAKRLESLLSEHGELTTPPPVP